MPVPWHIAAQVPGMAEVIREIESLKRKVRDLEDEVIKLKREKP